MSTTSFTSLHRSAGCVLALLLSSVCLCADAAGQTPLVVSSSAVAVPHSQVNGAPWQNAVSNRGDFVLFDFKTTGMYQFPGNGGAQITLAAPGKIAGGFTDSGIAIDPRNNNLYLDNNYNSGLIEYPFDAATGTWDLPSKVVASGLSGNLGGSCGNYFQSAGLAINDNGVMAVATENGCGTEIFTVPIDVSGNFGSATPIVSNMKSRAKTVAVDDAGNISFNEDAGLLGAYFIPTGTTGLASDAAAGITRFDPFPIKDPNYSVLGVSVDKAGNIYVADSLNGVSLVPLEAGVPNPAHAVRLTTALPQGNASIDQTRGVLFFPTSGYGTIKDDIAILLNRVEFGSAPLGTATPTSANVTYTFSGTVTPTFTGVTPYSFVVQQDGTAGDFTVGALSGCGISFSTDPVTKKQVETTTTYAPASTCAIPVSFTPHSLGDVSATLFMLDKGGNVLATTVLHGTGQASAIAILPPTESALGSGLQTPSQITTDTSGNIYLADSGLGKVLVYAKGSGATAVPTNIGTGLVAPTGVAVDGAGDVFIADGGKVFEVPYGPTGLNAAGQITLKTGLGTNLKLAADGIGNLYVGDPDNQRVVELRNIVDSMVETDITGFSALSAIAADRTGDLFVANGANLIEVSPFGAQTTVLTSLSGTTGLAADPSGGVYITSSSTTVRVPNEGGTLNAAHQLALASGATKPTAVAVDTLGNAYVTDGAAKNVDFISTNGSLTFGTLATTTSTQSLVATIANDGNLPLNITAFSHTADYSETASTCIGSPIAAGSSCTATITFNPGAGDQGRLSGQLTVQTDATNAPLIINVTGVGATLAGSTSTVSVTSPTVTNNAPISVTVASSSGMGPVPTGTVTLTVSGGFTPVTSTLALVNGAATFTLNNVTAGSRTYKVVYNGDRVYGTSTASTTVTVGPGTITLTQPPASLVPTYVLSSGTGSAEPYDGSQLPYYYKYPVTVVAANGAPLVGPPILNPGGTQIGTDYGTVSYIVSGGTPVCSGNSGMVPVSANGTAPFGTDCVTINTSNNQIVNIETSYTITPVYSGTNYAPVTGTPFTYIALRNPSVLITSNPASLTVAAGSSTTATLTLTSLLGYGIAGAMGNLNNYSLPLELECDNLPAHASCTFSYPIPDPSDANSVAVTTTTPGQVIMTINTNVAVGTSVSSLRQSPVIYAGVFCLSLAGLAFGRKKTFRASLLSIVCVLLFSGAVAGLSACSSAQIGATPVLTTPKGNYTVSVTAKQVGSKTVPGSTPGTVVLVQGNGNQMSVPFTMSVAIQ